MLKRPKRPKNEEAVPKEEEEYYPSISS